MLNWTRKKTKVKKTNTTNKRSNFSPIWDCCHDGSKPIVIGGLEFWPASWRKIIDEVLGKVDRALTFVSVDASIWDSFKGRLEFFPLMDCGGIPEGGIFGKNVLDPLIDWAKKGERVPFFCMGGHGRTGTVLACLVAKLMPEVEDPIRWVRKHYCKDAIESVEQVKYILKLKGMDSVKNTSEYVKTKPTTVVKKTFPTSTKIESNPTKDKDKDIVEKEDDLIIEYLYNEDWGKVCEVCGLELDIFDGDFVKLEFQWGEIEDLGSVLRVQ